MRSMATILIVDDDHVTVRLLQTLLELDGFQVHCASRGSEVPAAIANTRPDLLLVDYRLIDTDGLQVIRGLRAVQETERHAREGGMEERPLPFHDVPVAGPVLGADPLDGARDEVRHHRIDALHREADVLEAPIRRGGRFAGRRLVDRGDALQRHPRAIA